ncbi:hypothetical protein VOLCADRAFT_75879 [Volvox carteri f. nagariensis]|uniref:Zeaxanthin epoxidase, chloroplastic n=1 Tax=Volvox carteri f. nagariensis TaxID=3068 RepID=D8U4L4_VOLCA|nr:uncharacterized protein VOLCADRAFT_75879 [Volvox carteri f. nagariensis]EFJ45294.1 hypothetical protein VOLCADRAFT_75879 [Volvox carteri f. nagariensis]|eukprot:XP_002953670.1 hypothetical protein VOLCADRAFT_75879 [Volvox carteri f. nagariensis]
MLPSVLTPGSACSGSGRAAVGHVLTPLVPTVPSRAPLCPHLLQPNVVPQIVSQQTTCRMITHCATPRANAASSVAKLVHQNSKPMKIIIAGAGIGGLVLAVALLKQGFEVQVFERDLTAIRGEGKYRGPIQVQSNALAALEAIDPEVAGEVLREGCITGDRINGLCDGLTGEWYIKFDTFHPAVSKGLPVTRVISRVTLQHVLARAVERYGGSDIIQNGCCVTKFEERPTASGGSEVVVHLEDGRQVTGDLLIGADGIWSRIRKQLIGETKANYSGYTCYTGISDFTPADIDIVGYRVFLGNGQYFVSSDVGNGKMQWYGFHKEPAGGTDPVGTRKARLLEIFGHWNDNVVDLIKATPEEDVLRRDIYDRPPIFTWAKGKVALLGDSAHAMQPNLGQGGCMAIEDAYELAIDLSKAVAAAGGNAAAVNVDGVLNQYQANRMMRVSAIHGMAGMAAFMASTYKCYLGEGWSKWVESFRIPHPGRVIGRLVMLLTMPAVLDWVLGGNTDHVAPNRVPYCSLGDKPKAFDESRFGEFMSNDASIVYSSHADWILVSERTASGAAAAAGGDVNSFCECKGIYMATQQALVGRSGSPAEPALSVDDVHVHDRHAHVWREASGNGNGDGSSSGGSDYFLQDLGTGRGTWVNGQRIQDGAKVQLWPGDTVEFGRHPSHEVFKVKMQHVTLRSDELQGSRYSTLLVGKIQEPKADAQERSGAMAGGLGGGKLVAA